jgi:hypothetical protein
MPEERGGVAAAWHVRCLIGPNKAQSALEEVLLQIAELEHRLIVLRERAAKLAHYVEIATEYESEISADNPPRRKRRGSRSRAEPKSGTVIELPRNESKT